MVESSIFDDLIVNTTLLYNLEWEKDVTSKASQKLRLLYRDTQSSVAWIQTNPLNRISQVYMEFLLALLAGLRCAGQA